MADKLYKKITRSWSMYDWANSAFATTIMAGFMPLYYAFMAGEAGLTDQQATSAWTYTSTIALIIIALMAPALGYIADRTGSKKRLLTIFAVLGSVASMALFIPHGDMYKLASVIYIIGNIGFAGANIFYNALLPHVAKPEDIDQVSTQGYALGYMGGGLLFVLNAAMVSKPDLFGIPDTDLPIRLAFVTVGIWWLLFSIPLWRNVQEPKKEGAETVGFGVAAKEGFRAMAQTFSDIRAFPEAFKLLLAFWIYNDGIGTIIKVAVIYGNEIGIDRSTLIGALALVQFVGIPFSFAFGALAKRMGAKRSVVMGLILYTFITIGGFLMTKSWHFWVLAITIGLVQGGTQALSRSLFGSMIPKSESGKFFGFFSMSDKFAGIVGPLLFGLAGTLTGSSRYGIVSLIIFFIGGALLLTRVDVDKGIQMAREADGTAAA